MKLNRTGSNWNRLERNKINENWDIIEGSYNDVVGQITDEVVGHLIDSAKLIWKEPVDTVEDLPTNAEVGETRMVREADPDGISYVYRYDGENWEKIQEIDVTLVNEVDNRLSAQLADATKDLLDRGANPVAVYGADNTGTVDATEAIKNSFNLNKNVVLPPGEYLVSNLDIPDGCTLYGSGKTETILKKASDGYMIDLGRHSKIYDCGFDGQSDIFNGSGIVISKGENIPIRKLQGHQRIFRCAFDDMGSYHVEYTQSNKGWMSRLTECDFGLTNADAAVKWPDETTNGGNRYIIDCYSAHSIVNVGGCDNGIIAFNTVGGKGLEEEGIIFPSDVVNPSKKIIVIGNRLALANGSLRVRGIDHSFSDNIVAGDFLFDKSASGCSFAETNKVTGTFENSNTSNWVYGISGSFIPDWTASQKNPNFGDAQVTGLWSWQGRRITVDIRIKFGASTDFGEGTWWFGLPISLEGMSVTPIAGSVYSNKGNGVLKVTPGTHRVTLYRNDIVGTFSASSHSWEQGDELLLNYEYILRS